MMYTIDYLLLEFWQVDCCIGGTTEYPSVTHGIVEAIAGTCLAISRALFSSIVRVARDRSWCRSIVSNQQDRQCYTHNYQ